MTTFQGFNDIDPKILQQEELLLEATELLSTVMEENQITKVELARRLGKTKAFVTQCLSGHQNMTLRTLADLFHVLGYRLQLGAAPTAQTACKQIVQLYPIGGWAIEKAVKHYNTQRNDCIEEPADSRALYLCEAA